MWWPFINRDNEGVARERHNKSAPVAFVDGYVQSYDQSQVR